VGQLQQVLDGDLGPPQLDSDLDRDVENHVEFVHDPALAQRRRERREDIGRLGGGRSAIADDLFRHGGSPVVLADLAGVFGRGFHVFDIVSHFSLPSPVPRAVRRAKQR
jgi:hypothetical protein